MTDRDEPTAKRFRLTGHRFDGGRLPIDSLIELERYQTAIRAMAVHEWRRDHPGEDVPNGFAESLSLAIDEIRDGSADVFLAFEQIALHQQYRDSAQDAVDSTLVAAYGGGVLPELPDDVADEVREEIAKIGTTLVDGQSIEFFPQGQQGPAVTITVETRQAASDRLILDNFLSEPEPQPTSEVTHAFTSIIARVTVVDAERKRYELDSEQYGRVIGRYADNPGILADLRELVDSASEGPLTRVYGDMRFKHGKPWSFWTTESIERVEFDETPWGVALTSFARLPSGWADGEGDQISSVALEAAQMVLRGVNVAQPPALAPTEEGGVLIEWISTAGIRSVEVLADGTMELFSMQTGDRRGTQTETTNITVAISFANEDHA